MQCGFCVGKILIISFSFNFCIACAFTLESSLLMITLALFVAMDCSSITTSSHVRPVISPIRIEQENAKCIQMVNKSSSDCWIASRNVSTLHTFLFTLGTLGSVANEAGLRLLVSIYSQRIAWFNAQRIMSCIFLILAGCTQRPVAFLLALGTSGTLNKSL